MRKQVNKEIFGEILRRYFENHEGSTTLAKMYGINKSTIQKWLSLKLRKGEVQFVMTLNNWNLAKSRRLVFKRAAAARGAKSRKKVMLRFGKSFAYALGVLCGDGHVAEGYAYLPCHDIKFAESFLENGEKAFGIKASFNPEKKIRGLYRVTFHSRELADRLNDLYKTRTREWKIPPEIVNGNNLLKANFLKGFVDSEGRVGLSVYKCYYTVKSGEKRSCWILHGYVNLSSVNERGIKQVHKLLKDLGIRTNLYFIGRNDEWRISTVKNKSNLLLFQKLVDFRTASDHERLRFLNQNINHSPNTWRWIGSSKYLPKRCKDMMQQQRPRGVVYLDRQ